VGTIIMKALSVKQPWANMIASGKKTIEVRRWATDYRGQLLIVSSRNPPIEPAGCAVAIATVIECRKMSKTDEAAAACPIEPDAYAWVLGNVRRVRPFPVRGKLGIFDVPVSSLEIHDCVGESHSNEDN
jgi:ASCH domain